MKGTTVDALRDGQHLEARHDGPASASGPYKVLGVRPQGTDRWDQPVVDVREVSGDHDRILTIPEEWVAANLRTSTGEEIVKREPARLTPRAAD